jgi:hypothetical protein
VQIRAFGLAVCLVGCASYALCQAGSPNVAGAYQEFFRQVQILVNRQVEFQAVLPLTEEQATVVGSISRNVYSQTRRLEYARLRVRREVVDRLIQGADSVETSDWKKTQLNTIDNAQKQMVSAAIEKLRDALGNAGFRALDDYVRSGVLAAHLPKATK